MLLDLKGKEKKIPKKKKQKRLSIEEFIEAMGDLANANTDEFCIFYCRDGVDFKFSACSDMAIDRFIDGHKQDKTEELIFRCLDEYFDADYDDDYDDLTIEEEQKWIEDFIKDLTEKMSESEDNKDEEDED